MSTIRETHQHRHTNNTQQYQCPHCNAYARIIDHTRTAILYHCYRCGYRRETEL